MVAAEVVNDPSMLATFSMGKTRLFDASPLLEMPVFAPLEEGETFSRFEIVHEVVCWADGEINLSPEKMYELSYAYERIA